jgi:type II secretory ATPase GspE/PulE/Tfp pilus assembly ATPase PilB-like protein
MRGAHNTITAHDLAAAVALAAEVPAKRAVLLEETVWELIGRELSEGGIITLDGLGTFRTIKEPGYRSNDGEIGLPTVEPIFEPDASLIVVVERAQRAHPELFPDLDEDEDEEEGVVSTSTPSEAGQSESAGDDKQVEVKESSTPERPLAAPSNVAYLDLSKIVVDRAVLSLLPETMARRYSVAPVALEGDVLTVAMSNPEDFDALQLVRKETGKTIRPALASQDDLMRVYDQYTGLQAEVQQVIDTSDFGISSKDVAAAEQELLQGTGGDTAESPTARIVSSLLRRAVKEKASDIHLEPYEHRFMVRFRIDGVLMPKLELPKQVQAAIIARLKIIANLKIDEQRHPQDGRFSMQLDRREVDFRLSTIPVVFGEKVVMRILDKQQGIRTLTEVGLSGNARTTIERTAERSHGMILVTGPTGSGKTTTLYAVLGKLMSPDVNILTLEDPVEYRIESINQSQVHPDIGYTFAAGLRSVVRQDPDIVMLGEIRDHETAELAVQAALTGHVVLSTLHTNDSAGAFPRLIDMGVEPFLIASSVHTVVAQRLVRVIDPDQKEEYQLQDKALDDVLEYIEAFPEDTKAALKEAGVNLKKPVAYRPREASGYRGRLGVFEVLDVTEDIRTQVLERASGDAIKRSAVQQGMLTMIQDGLVKALTGVTSLEEVWRATRE